MIGAGDALVFTRLVDAAADRSGAAIADSGFTHAFVETASGAADLRGFLGVGSAWSTYGNHAGRRAVQSATLRVLVGLAAVIVLSIVGIVGLMLTARSGPTTTVASACPPARTVSVGTIRVPAGPVAGFCQDRLVNAAHIMNAARALGIGQHTQAIGVMTAIGESGLVNLDHGDVAGPDSRGLFQQRANGAWGSLADRMTPYTAAYDFFLALVAIPSWKSLSPTEAAHAVQQNADPGYYAQYWTRAVTVVTTLSR